MRRFIVVISFLFVVGLTSVAVLHPQSPNPNDAVLMKLDAQRLKAISDGDMNAVGALLANDYIHVNADGQILPRSVYFPHHLDNHRNSWRPPDAKVSIRYYGDIAIMVGPQLNDQVNRGVHEYAVTIIWHKVNGTWKEVGAAYSQVPVPCATARKNDLCRKE